MNQAKLGCCMGLLWLAVASGCDGSEDSSQPEKMPLSSSLPEDEVLDTLGADESRALCREVEDYYSQRDYAADTCRLTALLAAGLVAVFDESGSLATLRDTCSQVEASCLAQFDAAQGTDSCASAGFQDCDANVGEYVACISDSVERLHRQVSAYPACEFLTREQLLIEQPEDPVNQTMPESCQIFDAKCPQVPEETQQFAQRYCEVVQPCCAEANAGEECLSKTIAAARAGSYDSELGEICLARLKARRDEPTFCSGLGQVVRYAPWSPAIRECEDVFGSQVVYGTGDRAPGETCSSDDDCIPAPAGGAACVADFGSESFDRFCVQTIPGKLGDPCLASAATFHEGQLTEWPVEPTPTTGAICDRADGLYCDPTTQVCTATREPGTPCETPVECALDTYCNGECTPRVANGDACGDNLGECVEGSYCADAGFCTPLLGTGAACAEDYPARCHSGVCPDGRCANPLEALCGPG